MLVEPRQRVACTLRLKVVSPRFFVDLWLLLFLDSVTITGGEHKHQKGESNAESSHSPGYTMKQSSRREESRNQNRLGIGPVGTHSCLANLVQTPFPEKCLLVPAG